MTTVTDRFRIKIGGCYFINCRDLIVAHGESLFRIHRRDDDGVLLMDFDIYDAKGFKSATVRNGSIVDHDSTCYSVKQAHQRYLLAEAATGRVVCDIRCSGATTDGSNIEVSVDLHTKKGVHFVASQDSLSFAGAVLRGITMSDCAVGIVIQ